PEIRRPLHALESIFGRRRSGMLGPVLLASRVARARPDQRGIRALTLAQRLGRMRPGSLEADTEVGDQPDRDLVLAAAGNRLVVTLARVLPLRRGLAVVEDRLAVEAQLDASDDAACGAQQDVLSLV